MRLANDANCFALSEATDGAGAGAGVVFGVILGTGVGGGVVVHGQVLEGAHGIGGEWGHNPLPGMTPRRMAGSAALLLRPARLHRELAAAARRSRRISSGTPGGNARLDRGTDRGIRRRRRRRPRLRAGRSGWRRALASVVNILDPDVIVLGGGLSNIESLYRDLPALVETPCLHAGRPAAHRQEHAWRFQRRARRRLAVG